MDRFKGHYQMVERIRDLNGKSLGTYSEYLEHGRLIGYSFLFSFL
jgi:DNA-binding ferritin-like protein